MAKRQSVKARRQERKQQEKRNRQLTILGGIIGIVAVVAVLYFLANVPADAPISEDVTERYDRFITGINEDGYPRIGSADAPIEVVEFSSFSCPGCENFHATVFPTLLEYVEQGAINFTFVPMLTGSIPNAEGAARTALCASEQDVFWEMHDVLFEWHTRFVNNAYVSNRLTAGVEALGMDVSAYNECFNSRETQDLINLAQRQDVSVTPTVQVNGTTVDANVQAIETAIESRISADTEFAPGIIEEAEDIATEEAEDIATEEAEDTATEEAEDTATEEAEDMATEEVEDMATEEAEDIATEEAEDTATEEAEDTATEEAEDIATEEAEDIATEEATDSEE